MTVKISKADADDALQQHLQALALPGWKQLRLFRIGAAQSGLTKSVRTWSTQESMVAFIRKQNARRREKIGQIKRLVEQVGRESVDPYVFRNAEGHQICQEIRRLARELLYDFGWPQRTPSKRSSFMEGLWPTQSGKPPAPRAPRWHRLKRRTEQERASSGLRYHQPACDLLNVRPEISKQNVNCLRRREKQCGLTIPASVFELFSLRYMEDIFLDNTNQDSLVELPRLGEQSDDEVAIGYLEVAIENQGVVTWHVPLEMGDDPPVLQAPDGVVSEAEIISATFSSFVFDMIANNCFHGWITGLHLEGKAAMPDRSLLRRLRKTYQEGPRTGQRTSTAFRFFTPGSVLRIISKTP